MLPLSVLKCASFLSPQQGGLVQSELADFGDQPDFQRAGNRRRLSSSSSVARLPTTNGCVCPQIPDLLQRLDDSGEGLVAAWLRPRSSYFFQYSLSAKLPSSLTSSQWNGLCAQLISLSPPAFVCSCNYEPLFNLLFFCTSNFS